MAAPVFFPWFDGHCTAPGLNVDLVEFPTQPAARLMGHWG